MLRTLLLSLALLASPFFLQAQKEMDQTIYQFGMLDIDGQEQSLAAYKGKVVMIVNVASECGLTPQYEHLQGIYEQYKDQGFVILGFPANNFGAQEPGTNAEIKNFCSTRFHVTFPMFGKISVKGEDQDPLYQFLCSKEQNGFADSEVQWNFQKYLIDKEGHLIKVISPRTLPTDEEVTSAIETALK